MELLSITYYSLQGTLKSSIDHYFGGSAELLNMHERVANLLLMAQALSLEPSGKLAISNYSLAS